MAASSACRPVLGGLADMVYGKPDLSQPEALISVAGGRGAEPAKVASLHLKHAHVKRGQS